MGARAASGCGELILGREEVRGSPEEGVPRRRALDGGERWR
jgi:hypothetical protein